MIRPNHIFATVIVGLVAIFSVVLYNAIDDRRASQTEKNIDHNDYVIRTYKVFTVRTKEMCDFKVEVFLTHKQSFDPTSTFANVRHTITQYYHSKTAATVDLKDKVLMELIKFPHDVHAITVIPSEPTSLTPSQIISVNKERVKNKLQPFHLTEEQTEVGMFFQVFNHMNEVMATTLDAEKHKTDILQKTQTYQYSHQ